MGSSPYFILNVRSLPVEHEDVVTLKLFEGGATGVQENLSFRQQDRTYQPEVVETSLKDLIVYFESPPERAWLESLQGEFPFLQLKVEQKQRVDWLQQWKEQWQPFEWVPGFWIVPDWHRETFSPPQGECIFIEPGMAFGTGTHPTTQLAAQLMMQVCEGRSITSLLDVGTGSGILSLLAHKLNIAQVFAYDNDPESDRVFHENLAKNPSPGVTWVEAWGRDLAGKVDVTLANIIDGVLLNLKPEFQKVNSPFYIFTGILKERESLFLEEMQKDWSLQVLQRLERDDWVGFLLENLR